MNRIRVTAMACLASVVACAGSVQAQGSGASTSPSSGAETNAAQRAQAPGWPRQFETPTHIVRVHQPQVDEWPNFDRLRFRAAVAVESRAGGEPWYGTMVASCQADVGMEQRQVLLSDRKIEEIHFPGVDNEAQLVEAVRGALPEWQSQTVALDAILADLDMSKMNVRQVQVNVEPPKIFFAESQAVMVTFMGKPRFVAAPGGDLMVAVNTNWDLFLDPASGAYYLLNDGFWLTTTSLDAKDWQATTKLPAALSRLPDDDNWSEVKAALGGKPGAVIPKVFVSYAPAELLVVEGKPELQPLPGTRLMMVMNTENDLFYSGENKNYYLLAAGRWFASTSLEGPWTSASGSLPADFSKIPEDSDAADVRASVPGTEEATEAVLMASLPNRATVNIQEVKLTVNYDGEPDFRPIEQTQVKYAYNSPYSIFLVDGSYYCCHNAIWFVSPTPNGAWVAATAVPQQIYAIPATHPKYNVTYVTVYDSTPTTVTTSYTAGYTGAQVAATGVVMFGLGVLVGAIIDDDDPCWHYHYHSCFFSYGCGARWHGWHGGWVCAGHRYGPYGGCGGFAAYNANTGVFSRGAYAYGPRGAAGVRSAYNPSTGVFGYRAGATTPYQSWGRTAISNGDDWVRAGHRSGPRGSVAGIEGSGGAGAAHVEGRLGNGVTVAKNKDGDVYAGRDGNVYKKTDGDWEQAGRNRPEAKPATANAERDYLKNRSTSRERGERAVQRSRPSTTNARPSRGGGGRR